MGSNVQSMFPGDVFTTKNYGDVLIIDYVGYYTVVIKFINTGTIVTTRSDSVRSGKVVDFNFPKVCGVGYLGYGPHKSNTKAYSAWQNMIRRCHSDDFQSKSPSYIGCSVCEEWYNFQSFAEWYYTHLPENLYATRAEVDKDIKYKGNKFYSPETCKIVSPSENMQEVGDRALSKEYSFLDPSRNLVKCRNLRKYCRENSLDASCMRKVISGKQSHHKGYTRDGK